jgi:hypothetical protein
MRRVLFNKMLSECIKNTYTKGRNFVSDALFLILIHEQQKKINKLKVTPSELAPGIARQ